VTTMPHATLPMRGVVRHIWEGAWTNPDGDRKDSHQRSKKCESPAKEAEQPRVGCSHPGQQ